jgi:ubiquinol-cytochrome c reductase iron-sulfur subunit
MIEKSIDTTRRTLLTTTASVIGVTGAVAMSIPFFKNMLPSERARVGGAAITVDVQKIKIGSQALVNWRGKPVLILRRTVKMLADLKKLDSRLRDPLSETESQQPSYARNLARSIKPEFFICIGFCTHLGCVPKFRPQPAPSDLGPDWLGGYFCPCHGSRFDLAGRVYKGAPAPANLVIPPHRYESVDRVIIGEDHV